MIFRVVSSTSGISCEPARGGAVRKRADLSTAAAGEAPGADCTHRVQLFGSFTSPRANAPQECTREGRGASASSGPVLWRVRSSPPEDEKTSLQPQEARGSADRGAMAVEPSIKGSVFVRADDRILRHSPTLSLTLRYHRPFRAKTLAMNPLPTCPFPLGSKLAATSYPLEVIRATRDNPRIRLRA